MHELIRLQARVEIMHKLIGQQFREDAWISDKLALLENHARAWWVPGSGGRLIPDETSSSNA